ncbi:Aste57867_17233 [Aphanomyces stellatus]|uniref:beta-glucosidase n=1 Tax=Aphanomyces stellatus TaxID=120398 RepID=A0A485L8Z1_9STRA|nr:hypothetical protein As57867_017174 [Aphanomyces stellatus]VFT93989.1 Aste57867_17233 [Aphanomyces stellatus]
MRTTGLFIAAVGATAATITAPDLDAQVQAILAKLTINQMVAQMNQIDINSFKMADENDRMSVNVSQVREYAKLYVGSYLNNPFGGPNGNKYNLNATEFRNIITKIQDVHMNVTGIPIIYGLDSLHGANYVYNASLFPQSINTGATFNIDLARQAGLYTGRDTKAAGIPWVFGPMLEPVRHKHWPRVYESFNEDPHAVAALGAAYVEGMQSQGVAACLKHLIAYSDPFDGNDRSNVYLSAYELQNYFVPPFQAAIDDGGALTVMGSYIALNGVPVAANSATSIDLLRKDLGFTGVLVSDFIEVYLLHTMHQVAASNLDAVALNLNKTSYDMSMVPFDTSFLEYTEQLLATNRTTAARIQESAARILKLKLQLDLFNHPVPGADVVAAVGDAPSQAAARAAAQESIVLLKNTNNVLPLRPSQSVLLTGQSIDDIGDLCGGWTLYWQGVGGNNVFPHGKSIRGAVEALTNQSTYLNGIGLDGNLTDPVANITAAAVNASVTVVALGENPYAENAGNDYPQDLPAGFATYLKLLKATGTKIVLVLVEGRPRTLNGLADLADAVLWAGLPCEKGGYAIADVLYGNVNPSGKLPYTYPKTDAFMNLKTPYYQRNATHCLTNGTALCPTEWAFGAGLSYTTFEYSKAKLSSTSVALVGGPTRLTASVTVKNTGTRVGQETIMLFLVPPPGRVGIFESKLLKKFTKLQLAPNEAKDVSFELAADDWGYVSAELGQGLTKSAPSGTYTLAWKASTDCAADPKDPLCLPFQWTNANNAPLPPPQKGGGGGGGTSLPKSDTATTASLVATLALCTCFNRTLPNALVFFLTWVPTCIAANDNVTRLVSQGQLSLVGSEQLGYMYWWVGDVVVAQRETKARQPVDFPNEHADVVAAIKTSSIEGQVQLVWHYTWWKVHSTQ